MFSDILKSEYDSIGALSDNVYADIFIDLILSKERISFNNLISLILSGDTNILQKMAAKASVLTRKRFGKTISFYTPLYLSNECDSVCLYCGYSKNRKIKRVTLSLSEIEENYVFLKNKGFDNILLVTGESRKHFNVSLLSEAVKLAKKYFTFVGIEVYPMTVSEYREVLDSGCDGLTVYQETYDPKLYSKYHLEGEKTDYVWRLDTPDRALEAGFRKIGLGVLLGLKNPVSEIACLARHIDYLEKTYWRSEISIGFPRIRPENILSKVPFEVTDKMLTGIICALRIYFPENAFVLSTRESPFLRDRLIDVGITQVSAGSKTNPGGYLSKEGDGQFVTSDNRTIEEMIEMVRKKGYDPVLKDWSQNFAKVDLKNAD